MQLKKITQVNTMGATCTEVSVVIPAYNAAKFLSETLLSILAQEDVDFELLVVDDCSTDETAEIVKAAAADDGRVKYLCTPLNSGGPAGPRNMGVHAARSRWVAFCDADDIWHPRKLRLQIDLAQNECADLVCSAIKDFIHGTKPILPDQVFEDSLSVHCLPYWQMLLKDRIATSSALCSRDALIQIGGFNTARDLVAVEDYDLWLRLMERPSFKVLRIETPLVAYRKLPQSLSANKLRHAVKVMRVPRLAAKRGGLGWIFPLFLPVIFAGYVFMSLYWRVLNGRL
jgi:teichuronic acid biosynthesis glycosyltransferase TuaG